jgi:hypothetical protein
MQKIVLTEEELAQRWSVTIPMLRAWRQQNKGIGYIGKSVRYPINLIEQYEIDNLKNGGTNE